jgi:hypothetical protein
MGELYPVRCMSYHGGSDVAFAHWKMAQRATT